MLKDIPIYQTDITQLPIGRITLHDDIEQLMKKGRSFTISPVLIHGDNQTRIIGITIHPDPIVELIEVPWPIGDDSG